MRVENRFQRDLGSKINASAMKKRGTYKDPTWRMCHDLTGFWGNRKNKEARKS